ncbi:MAG TPA: allantoate amidohydrolase [Streptosporangiaceae bacterium]|nr:allantoate amidohydrolase [Streptosporangiaceae bacterium]
MSFEALWESLLPVGRDGASGGYRRFSWTPEDAACRAWFTQTAAERGLRVLTDRNGNLWAWWDPPGAPPRESAAGGPAAPARTGAVVTGSHLDSVPDGGAFDGPLGVVSAFAALDLLRERGCLPVRPLGVAAFTEEEGARFGVACLGSRLLAGAIDPGTARALADAAGITLAEAMAVAGHDPEAIGPDDDLLATVGAYVELHIEQGRALADLDAAIGIGEQIWPHGRWRLGFTGRPDHAGTAVLADRHDPMLPFAAAVLAARQAAASHGALATVGKVAAEPGAVNAVSARVTAWLDARGPDEETLQAVVGEVLAAAREAAASHGVELAAEPESATPAVRFDPGLREALASSLAARDIRAPVLPTGAGHDAGVLAARLPTAMLFVRNPTGVSHSPAEHAEPADCAAGVQALAAVLADLACR